MNAQPVDHLSKKLPSIVERVKAPEPACSSVESETQTSSVLALLMANGSGAGKRGGGGGGQRPRSAGL